MKKILSLILLAALSAQADTITNGVKVSALPAASTPLTGSEIVPLVQSGTTKQATVGQVQAIATATANAAQSYAAGASNALAAAIVATNALTAARELSQSNSLHAAIDGTNTLLLGTINTAANLGIQSGNAAFSEAFGASNAITAALIATNNLLKTAINAAAATAGSGIQNGGNGVLQILQVTNLIVPTTILTPLASWGSGGSGAQTTLNLDCSKANYFQINQSANNTLVLNVSLVNWTDGQTIVFMVKVPGGSGSWWIKTPATISGATLHGTALNLQLFAGDTVYLNWSVVGTDIIFSGGKI